MKKNLRSSAIVMYSTWKFNKKFARYLPGKWDSLVAQMVKDLPAMWETWV